MELKRLTEENYAKSALKLYHQGKMSFSSFNGFDLFNKKIILGQNSYLQSKLKRTHFAGVHDGEITCMTTYYEALDKKSASLGNFLVSSELNSEVLDNFLSQLQTELKNRGDIIAPINGHPNLGFTYPEGDESGVGFLTASPNPVLDKVFSNSKYFEKAKKYYSYNMKVDEALKEKIKTDLSKIPQEFSTRNISRLHFKRDVEIYNKLVGVAMSGHDNFIPLEASEEWELMRDSILILNPDYFKFLIYKNIEIGFCFGIPNYNQIFKNGQDFRNILRAFASKRKITQARIIYSGIMPEWRGQGLFKFVRHKVIQSMIENGVTEIESSYIDEVNTNSIKNVESTGAKPARQFHLYRFKN